MTTAISSAAIFCISKIFALLALCALTLNITGCACSVLSSDAWSGGGACAQQQQAERENAELKSQHELPALKKRADGGDEKAQMAMGNFHIFEHHPNSDRAAGLAYFDKAGREGDLLAQRIFLSESHKDCQNKARKLGLREVDGPQFAPYCITEWAALEALAKKACVRTSSVNISSSIQVALGQSFESARKGEEADFGYVVAMTHCLTAQERASNGEKSMLIGRGIDGRPQEVRGAMWLGVRGRDRFPTIPLGTPEVEQKAKVRLAMLREKVAASKIRPAIGFVAP